MADCERSAIPEELIIAKGNYKCDSDFVPGLGEDGNPVKLVGFRTTNNCGTENNLLLADIPETFDMNPDSYSEDFMSWKSEVYTFHDNDNQDSNIFTPLMYSLICDGLCTNPGPPPEGGACATRTDVDVSYGVGENTNYLGGLYGRTVQFYFNIYKRYCCVLDDSGNVIDFDYQYYYVKIQLLDGIPSYTADGSMSCGCGEIDFCEEHFSIGGDCTCYFGVRDI